MLEDNRGVHRLTLDYFKGWIWSVGWWLWTGLQRCVGYFLNDEMFVSFMNRGLDCKGLAGFIFREFCADRLRGVKFINVMDDFAMDKWPRQNCHTVRRCFCQCM